MKKVLLSSILFLMSQGVFASVSSEVTKIVDSFPSKGTGSYIKNNKTLKSNVDCLSYVENVDIWNSDFTLTANVLNIFVDGNEISDDLDQWDDKNSIRKTLKNDVKSFTIKYDTKDGCAMKVNIKALEKSFINYTRTKTCKKKVSSVVATCKY